MDSVRRLLMLVKSAESADKSSRSGITPLSHKAVMTTSWDDGHPLDLRIAELLAKHGLTGTFYVPIRGQREVLTKDELRSMSSQFEIGCHTVNHLSLTELNDATAWDEIHGCKQIMEDMIGKTCKVFCFPNGDYLRRHLSMARSAGYMACRTVELLSLAHPQKIGGISVIQTTIQAFPHSTSDYLRNGLKRMVLSSLWRNYRFRPGRDWVRAAIALIEYSAMHGGMFHLWGHSWEIDQCNDWKSLDAVLAVMARFSKSMHCVTNSQL